ncbi:MAG: serine/threonine-protein kinase, partial [Gemmatimonadales bacterium]
MAAAPSGLVPRLQDRYSLEQVLGSGGMATVYLARDLRDDSRVALKVLRPELVPILGPERFAREIRITSNLKHPNILPVLDSGCTEDGVSFYVTPYVDGGSLAQRLRREPQLPIADALEITRQIAYALETAHDQGIVHRDIKPSNILLADRRAILADFGLARAVDVATAEKLTESGIVLGTPAYMSPEQSAGGPLDRRSDIYSLGCVVFEMLAGTPPFSASSAQSLHARHAMDPPPSVRTVRPTVSPSLEHAINTALAKVPADRFGTAAAFAEALATGAYSLPLWRRAAKPLLAAGIVLAAVFGSWAVAGSRTGSLDRNKVVVYPLAERGER